MHDPVWDLVRVMVQNLAMGSLSGTGISGWPLSVLRWQRINSVGFVC